MSLIKLGYHLLAAGVLASTGTALFAAPASQPPVTQTQVIKFQPTMNTNGAPPQAGNCWTHSIAVNRPDAWRCMVGNSIYDPCFTTKEANTMICNPDPAFNKPGFILKLTQALPNEPAPAPSAPGENAWMVKLQDGRICSRFTGTMPFVKNVTIGYGCTGPNGVLPEGESNILVGLTTPFNTSGKVWTATMVTANFPSKGAPIIVNQKQIPIVTVWE